MILKNQEQPMTVQCSCTGTRCRRRANASSRSRQNDLTSSLSLGHSAAILFSSESLCITPVHCLRPSIGGASDTVGASGRLKNSTTSAPQTHREHPVVGRTVGSMWQAAETEQLLRCIHTTRCQPDLSWGHVKQWLPLRTTKEVEAHYAGLLTSLPPLLEDRRFLVSARGLERVPGCALLYGVGGRCAHGPFQGLCHSKAKGARSSGCCARCPMDLNWQWRQDCKTIPPLVGQVRALTTQRCSRVAHAPRLPPRRRIRCSRPKRMWPPQSALQRRRPSLSAHANLAPGARHVVR
jgi:hypothetical protein